MASLEEKAVVNDEAPSTVSYTQEEERALVRKLDWRIMPIACIMYLFACEYPVTAIARESFEHVLCLPRPRPDEPRERTAAGASGGCAWWGPDGKAVRLGQLGVLLSLRTFHPCTSTVLLSSDTSSPLADLVSGARYHSVEAVSPSSVVWVCQRHVGDMLCAHGEGSPSSVPHTNTDA